MKHLQVDINKEKLNNISSKYRTLPEEYYGGVSLKFVTPKILEGHQPSFKLSIA